MTEQSTPSSGEVEEWLLSLASVGAPRGAESLARAARLVDALDHPQRTAPAVHVVGTAGKSTVVGLLGARAVAAGWSVATHQSPHVADIRERFLLDEAVPDDDELAGAVDEVRRAVEVVRRRAGGPPSFFAATAALSWVLGRARGVDLFITEAGIGGRLDATAVLDRPDTLTVVTAIGLDHTEVLGETVEAIAAEKAAVLRGRSTAVLGPQPAPRAARVVRSQAAEFGTVLIEVEPQGEWRLDARATAEAAAGELGLPATGDAAPLPPGRYEIRTGSERRLVLDGAHNPLKLAALVATLAADEPPAVAVVALGATKDVDGCAVELARLGRPIVVTEFGGAEPPHSHPATVVVDALRSRGATAVAAVDAAEAARVARRLSEPGDTIVVTGSFLVLEDVAAALARS